MIKKIQMAVLLLLSTITLGACGVGEAKLAATAVAADVDTPLPVDATWPERADIFATYEATSTLASDADAPVLARAAGSVIEILVEEGNHVEKGQVLARLDGEQLRLEMLQEKTNLDKTVKEYERLVVLQERGLISKAMFEGLKFDIRALEASYKLKQLNYSYTNIRAPISGVVASRDIKVGRQVYVNDLTFRITDATELLAYLKIPQSELVKFSKGQSIELSVDAMPEIMFAATIDRISPTIDVRNGTFRATVYIDNKSGDLAPGMFARFSISYEKHANALIIPAAALVKEDSVTVVYVINEGTAERRILQTGISSNGMVEILSGLDINESVVIAGQTGLRDGSLILASDQAANRFSG